MNLQSPEMLINMKSIPDEESVEYKAFWKNEAEKIRNGVTINGYTFSPFLYWHLNLWSIYSDKMVNGRQIRSLGRPEFWDSMIEIDDTITRAETFIDPITGDINRKGVLIVGSRRISKTVFGSSYNAHKIVAYKGSEVLISALNQPDIKVITDYIDLGLRNLPEYFRFSRIEDDWKKGVTLGFKDKKTNLRQEWSKVHIRNFDEGNNTEAAAGLTLSGAYIDEVGKGKWLNCFSATTPCFDSPFGWRCSPIATATGGDMKKATDAQQVFYNPESFNFLPVSVSDENTKISLFIPGTKSLRVPREEKVFSDYIGAEKGSELDLLKIYVADEERGKQLISINREQKKKAEGMEAYLKEIMYYPLTPEECFLDVSENIFPVELLQHQLTFLESNNIKSTPVELYRDNEGKVKHRFTDKKPVEDYPASPKKENAGVVQIWEFPKDNAPAGLYTSGTDPYKQAEAVYSTSLGCTYIYKRIHNIGTEGWQNMLVACYCGRPKKLETWFENTKLLLEYYNAKTLCENEDLIFIRHCIEKNEAHKYLERTPKFLTDVHPNSTVNRDYGIHMTTDIKRYLVGLLITYINQEIGKETDEDGNVTKIKYGASRILDPLLIREMIKFNYKANTDRVISAGLALAMAGDLNTKIIVSSQEDSRYKDYISKTKKNKSPFISSPRSPFINFK